MSLSPFNFKAVAFTDLFKWFIEIFHHLGDGNYQHGSWAPDFKGVTGSPTVSTKFTRWGQAFNFVVVVNGACTFNSAYIDNLPFAATDYGLITVYDPANRSVIGNGYVNKETKKVYFSDFTFSGSLLIIEGSCRIAGV